MGETGRLNENIPESLQKMRMMEICTKNLRPSIPDGLAQHFEVEPAQHAEYCGLMKECWRRNPAERHSFETIQTRLAVLHGKVQAAKKK